MREIVNASFYRNRHAPPIENGASENQAGHARGMRPALHSQTTIHGAVPSTCDLAICIGSGSPATVSTDFAF